MNDLSHRVKPGMEQQKLESDRGSSLTNGFIVVLMVALAIGAFTMFSNTHTKNTIGGSGNSGLQSTVGSQASFAGQSEAGSPVKAQPAAIDGSKMTDREREQNMTPFMQNPLQSRR